MLPGISGTIMENTLDELATYFRAIMMSQKLWNFCSNLYGSTLSYKNNNCCKIFKDVKKKLTDYWIKDYVKAVSCKILNK